MTGLFSFSLAAFAGVLLAGCTIGVGTPLDAGGEPVAPEDQVMVVVRDETDKAYTDQVGDVSSFYRDIATKVVGGLANRGIAATSYDVEGARRLIIRLIRFQIDNDSGSSVLRLRLRAEFSAETDGWRRTYNRDDDVQRSFVGGASPSDIRDLLAMQVALEITNDDDLLAALGNPQDN